MNRSDFNVHYAAIVIDRCLKINLSNSQYECLIQIIETSGSDPITTTRFILLCDREHVLNYINNEMNK